MASPLYASCSVMSSCHANSGVSALSHDGLHSRRNSVLPLKLSVTGLPLKSTAGFKRAIPLQRVSIASLGQYPSRITSGVGNASQQIINANEAVINLEFPHNQSSIEFGDVSTGRYPEHQFVTKVVPVLKRAGPKPRVILIAGPTAIGKTRLSIELAKTLGGEIINADSVQVYQGLDVGAAKATMEERQGIPHHLMDVLPPTLDYSYSQFLIAARSATEQILAKGLVPIVVGGTGMYLRWYMHNRPNLTSHPFEGEQDPFYAPDWDYDFQCYFLYQHRADLYPRVDIRCEQMVPALLAETSWLMDLGVQPDSNLAARAIGYEEAMELLLEARNANGYISHERFMRFLCEFQRNSKELVRKQIAWFRSERRSEVRQFRWLPADVSVEALVDGLVEEYRRAPGETSGISLGRDLKHASLVEQRRLKEYRAALHIFSDSVAVASTIAWIKNRFKSQRCFHKLQ